MIHIKNVGEFQNYYAEETKHKSIHIMWFYFRKIHKQEELTYVARGQNSACLEGWDLTRRACKINF